MSSTYWNILSSIVSILLIFKANNSDILLFHRKRTPQDATAERKSKKRGRAKLGGDEPIAPVDLAEIGIDELIKDNLESVDAKLEVLDEPYLASALDEFVEKELRDAFDGAVDKVTAQQHRKLVQRGIGSSSNADGDESKITTSAAVREICSTELEKKKQDTAMKLGTAAETVKRSVALGAEPSKRKVLDDDYDDDDYDDDKLATSSKRIVIAAKKDSQPASNAVSARNTKKPTREAAKAASARFASTLSDDDLNFSDEDMSVEEVKTKSKGRGKAATATGTTNRSKRKTASESTKTTGRGRAISHIIDSDDESDVDDDIQVIGVSGGKGWGISQRR